MYRHTVSAILIILGFAGAIIYKIPTQTILDPPIWMQVLGTIIWAWPYEVLLGLLIGILRAKGAS